MSLPIVSMKDVSIGFPGTEPFKHINFQIKKNECWALMGDNDSLINAMMEAIAGKAIISKGKLEFNFDEKEFVGEKKPSFHSVALLSTGQNFRNLSGVDESYYQQRYNSQDSENSLTLGTHLTNLYPNKSETLWTLKKILDTLHLGPLLEEHLIKLSTGETKRVRIAEALSLNPKILLLNHIFTGLDVQSRKEIMHFIDAISTSGITIVMHTTIEEIPNCITHVAYVSAENEIQIFLKNDFKIKGKSAPKSLNMELLKTLLSINTLPQFDTIVGMKNVSIEYDGHVILDRINWEIKQGERWALSGPNGSGKTTLLSLINGDNPQAFANDIILFDRKKGSGESIWDIKKKIGFFSTELYQYFPPDTQCVYAIESGFFDT
ncbi:MAG: ATP-binding cassette domain-containing protein, partial [Ginsengibacter sp.]